MLYIKSAFNLWAVAARSSSDIKVSVVLVRYTVTLSYFSSSSFIAVATCIVISFSENPLYCAPRFLSPVPPWPGSITITTFLDAEAASAFIGIAVPKSPKRITIVKTKEIILFFIKSPTCMINVNSYDINKLSQKSGSL